MGANPGKPPPDKGIFIEALPKTNMIPGPGVSISCKGTFTTSDSDKNDRKFS